MTQAMDIALDYLTAFYSDDRQRARQLLADDVDFGGPFVAVVGADSFMDSARRLLESVAGTRVVRSWSQGDEVSVIHEVAVADQIIPMAEWLTVRDGRVVRQRVYVDSAPLVRALAPERPPR